MSDRASMLKPAGPVLAGALLAGLHEELMRLLRDLDGEDWERPTSAGHWRVRDVVAHLLDTDLRRLSSGRDGHRTPLDRPVESYDDLLAFLNELNADWIRATRRVSPAVLVDVLAHVGPQSASFLASLDPFAPAALAVAWAGPEPAPNWLDVGREYTERWHHQDQIGNAVGAPALAQERWLRPVVEISLHALPFAFRDVAVDAGAAVVIELTGEVDDVWSLVRNDADWALYTGRAPDARARIALDALIAARLLLHRLTPDEARRLVTIEGDEQLGLQFLATRAVMV